LKKETVQKYYGWNRRHNGNYELNINLQIVFSNREADGFSKGKTYKDRYTIVLGIATFVAVALQISYFIAWLIYPDLIWVFLSILILKSIPDCLIC